jgi:predicted flap endonuclease-1-like 5' DNA nuclease
MQIWVWLVVGIIIGWLGEWVVDWLYWRRNIPEFYANESRLSSQVEMLHRDQQRVHAEAEQVRAQLAQTQSRSSQVALDLSAGQQQIEQLRSERDAAQAAAAQALGDVDKTRAENQELQQRLAAALATIEAEAKARRDDLEQIDGIGPVFEQKLFAAGIETYSQLAGTSVDRLREIVAPAAWQNVDFEGWRQQAREFAAVVVVDLLPYRLEEVRGIGPTYAQRLNAAGIQNFTDLAACTVDQLREIIAPKTWQAIDFGAWIQQAKAFAALISGDRPPLPLEQVKGIGPVLATKLDLAGIKSFADLAQATPEQIQEALGARGSASERFADWIAQAQAVVAEQGDASQRAPDAGRPAAQE